MSAETRRWPSSSTPRSRWRVDVSEDVGPCAACNLSASGEVSGAPGPSTPRAEGFNPMSDLPSKEPSVEIQLCSNAAFDMERRVSAHAIFSVVSLNGSPFEFPGPFYAVVQLFDAEPGDHQINVWCDSEKVELEAPPITLTVRSERFAIGVVRVNQCVIKEPGSYWLKAQLDGEKVKGKARLLAIEVSQRNEGTEDDDDTGE
jgi:hypothetical protein